MNEPDDSGDKTDPTLVFANPLGDRSPRPTPVFVTKAEFLEEKRHIESLETRIHVLEEWKVRLDKRFLELQVDAQRQHKTVLGKLEEIFTFLKTEPKR